MLRDELKNAMKDAMREKRTHELATIRLILAAVKDRDIAAREHGRMDGVDDDSIRDLLQKMIKQRGESIALYEQGGRLELAEAERAEIDIIKGFLPAQMSEDEVKAAVDQARSSLPEGIDEPVVTRSVYSDRVTDVVMYGPVDIDQLARFAEDLQTVFFRQGVTRVTIRGLEDPIIRVNVGENMLVRHGLTLAEIADVVSAEMETTPAGDVAGSSARLRTGQTRRSEQELGEIVLKAPSQGEKLELRSVADIVTEGVESGRAYYHKGMPAVVLRVSRSAQGDTIEIQRAVERITADFQHTLPEGVVVQLTNQQSHRVQTSNTTK